MFKRVLIAAAVAVSLGACAVVSGSETGPEVRFEELTPATQVYVLKDQFDTQLDMLKAYAAQPACSATVVVGCHDPKVVDRLAQLAAEVDAALDLAEASVFSGSDDAADQIMAARAMLNQLINAYVAKEAT